MNLSEYIQEAVAKGSNRNKYSEKQLYTVLADPSKLTNDVVINIFKDLGFKMVPKPMFTARQLQMSTDKIGSLSSVQLVFTDETYIRFYFMSDGKLISIHFFDCKGDTDPTYEVAYSLLVKINTTDALKLQTSSLVRKLSDEGILIHKGLTESITSGHRGTGKYDNQPEIQKLRDIRNLTMKNTKELFKGLGFRETEKTVVSDKECLMASEKFDRMMFLQLSFKDLTFVRMCFNSQGNKLLTVHFYCATAPGETTRLDPAYDLINNAIVNRLSSSFGAIIEMEIEQLIQKLKDEDVL